jgi:DNA-binding transcriptional LysR family regulator
VDVHHVRYFLAVCETLNFTRAAEHCKVTQPALSRAIGQLEDEVGGLLFRRERALTHLTDLGMVMKPRLEAVIRKLEAAEREAKRYLTMDEASLKLGIICTIGPRRVAGALAAFHDRYPQYTVNVSEGAAKALIGQLDEGAIDLAIAAQPEVFDKRFEVAPLYRERFLVAFAAGHRLAGKTAVPLAELNGEEYLNRVNCEFGDRIDGILAARHCDLKVAYESDKEDWIQNLAAGGMGICIIPEFSAVAPGLLVVPIVDPEIAREVSLVSLAGKPRSQAMAHFMAALKDMSWPQSRFGEPVRTAA